MDIRAGYEGIRPTEADVKKFSLLIRRNSDMKPRTIDAGLADKSILRRAWEGLQYHYWGLHLAVKWQFHKKKSGGIDGKTVPRKTQ